MKKPAQKRRLVGYARVSTDEQDTAAQQIELRAAGCTDVIIEHAFGAYRAGPALVKLVLSKAARPIRPSSTRGAAMPVERRPATRVVVIQCPCCTPESRRSPFMARPQRRAMLVEAQVSSMKIRRARSRSSWPWNYALRPLRM